MAKVILLGTGAALSDAKRENTYLVVQGERDQYGTLRQVEIAKEECYCPVDVTVVPNAGHSPQREAPEATLDAISQFASAVLRSGEGSHGRAA